MKIAMLLAMWIGVGVIIYTYVGFPALVGVAGLLLRRRVRKKSITPSLSLIIAAHNEEKSIARKLDNALALDYPREALEVIVASDGSDDGTNSIVAGYDGDNVQLLRLPRSGKIAALNESANRATGEILVFTDANTLFDARSLRELVKNFADPQVGGVCGNQQYLETGKGDVTGKGESNYWNYDKRLKKLESETGSIVSADGAIWAIRKELYRAPASVDVTDDFAISTGVIEQGYRLVFDDKAVVYELPMASAEAEFNRKVRIINCGLRGVLMRKSLLNPFKFGFYSLVLFTHKILRRFVPFVLVSIFVISIWLSRYEDIYRFALLVQCLFYLTALAGYGLKNHRTGGWKLFYIPFYYCLVNAAALVAVLQIIAGKRIAMWNPERQN